MNLEVVNKGFTRLLGSKALLVKAHSPEILMFVGIAGIVSSTILACRATLKSREVLADAKENLISINGCWEKVQHEVISVGDYSEMDHKKDLTIVYTQTAVKFLKLYGPAVILGTASIACVVGGHNILRQRNVALMAAYKTLDKGFRAYRRRVVDEYGEDKDYTLAHDLRAETLTTVSTTGKGKPKTVETTTVYSGDPNGIGPYAKFFDECSPEWQNNPEYNKLFLMSQQNYVNNLLQVRGAVFLNEVYDLLGLARTSAGSVVGWKIGNGDGFIDFGIFDGSAIKREFINGFERSILLDFNVDGVIYDLI